MEAIRFDDEMVRVQLVCDRAEKDDCRAGTPIKWHGQGDIKLYPKRLWPKLEPHPDVWRLLPSAEDEAAAARKRIADAAEIMAKAKADLEKAEEAANAEKARRAELEANLEAERLARERQEALGCATDVVNATPAAGAAQPALPQSAVEAELTVEEINAMPDEDLKAIAVRRQYGLHPRLNPENLRTKFLEAQDAQFEEAGRVANASGQAGKESA